MGKLVAYSGFSSSNYLEQPYNSDLDFGTGDFCYMGWINSSSFAANQSIMARTSATGSYAGDGESMYTRINTSGQLSFGLKNGSAPATFVTSNALPSATWAHICIVRRSNTLQWYVNGVTSGSPAGDSRDVSNTTYKPKFWLGREYYAGGGFAANNSSLALWRISGTAPTAEQIAKIYEDEKVLFQEGAQATLYGSSDAVTALAYDDTTDLLHVGTSAGRSDFSGLRRVGNTTDAVGTAISASNGMIVEE